MELVEVEDASEMIDRIDEHVEVDRRLARRSISATAAYWLGFQTLTFS